MTNFAVGDRVRISDPGNNIAHNKKGTIVSPNEKDWGGEWMVKLDELPFNRPYYSRELVKIS